MVPLSLKTETESTMAEISPVAEDEAERAAAEAAAEKEAQLKAERDARAAKLADEYIEAKKEEADSLCAEVNDSRGPEVSTFPPEFICVVWAEGSTLQFVLDGFPPTLRVQGKAFYFDREFKFRSEAARPGRAGGGGLDAWGNESWPPAHTPTT